MGQTLDLEADPVPPPQHDPMDMGAAAMQNGTAATGAAAPPADDDINDYMAQLLQRVGGTSDAEAKPAAAKAAAPSKKETASKKPVAAPKMPPAEPKKPVEKLKELPPAKRHVSENTMSLAAMRELANQTNRSAIRSHARKQRKAASSAKFMLSLSLVLGSLMILFIPFIPLLVRSVIGITMLGIGVFSCLRAMRIDAVGKLQDVFRKNGDR